MKEPQLTAVSVALPERIHALSHVVDDINEFLKPKTIDAAVYNDCQYVIRVHGSTRRWTKKAMDEAAARGRLDIVRWLYLVRNEGCTIAAIDEAAVNGHLDVVKWLRAHCFRKCSDGALNAAAKNGHSEVVKWLCRSNRVGNGDRNREPYVVADGVQVVASRGDVETLSVLVRENCDWYHLGCALERAAGDGQAEVVKVLLSVELQQSCVGKALKKAVLMNRIEVVELLADQCSSMEIRAAFPVIATKGNAKIAKVLREAIRRRLTEEKWGYVTTQSNILERVKASQEMAQSITTKFLKRPPSYSKDTEFALVNATTTVDERVQRTHSFTGTVSRKQPRLKRAKRVVELQPLTGTALQKLDAAAECESGVGSRCLSSSNRGTHSRFCQLNHTPPMPSTPRTMHALEPLPSIIVNDLKATMPESVSPPLSPPASATRQYQSRSVDGSPRATTNVSSTESLATSSKPSHHVRRLSTGQMADETVPKERIDVINDFLQERVTTRPLIGVVCGSGLGGLSKCLSNQQVIKYADIPQFPRSTVEGHAGELVFGDLEGFRVVCMRGRFHCYEGYAMRETALPIRVMYLLGIKYLLVTNAAGGLNPDFNVGDLMVMNDHLNMPGMSGQHPLIGPNDARFGARFTPLSNCYDKKLQTLALDVAKKLGLASKVRKGVYCFVSGPTYETPTECRFLRLVGGDAVGMSTVPEVIVAAHCGLKVIGLSLITNKALFPGEERAAASHNEVLETVQATQNDIETYVRDLIAAIGGQHHA